MDPGRLVRGAWLVSSFCCVMSWPAGTPLAATLFEFVDPNPAPGNLFGQSVVPLSTGNVVITSPGDDAGGADAGAVYLFNGSTGALISTLRGSHANDRIGEYGLTALTNGNYVVASAVWDNGAVVDAGAVSWGSGTTGLSGVVSAANSLVGSTANDNVGSGFVTALSNGNYVVVSRSWDNGGIADAGAATWGSGTTGVKGVVSAANSLVGSAINDDVGGSGVTALTNGNYVVGSPNWDNGAVANVGAATWGSGTAGLAGLVSAANSLVGSTPGDNVGGGGVTALSNGNYVVRSQNWDNGAIASAGAATWGDGTTGVSGVVSAANSLVGSTLGDQVGVGVTALTNGNYVVRSQFWDNGVLANVGAATWASGTSGATGVVSAVNSLVGSTGGDNIGSNGVTALANGNYVVASRFWDSGPIGSVGAATWGSGTTGVTGVVSAANSLVGSTSSDQVGASGVTALSNGNYVVGSQFWDTGGVPNVGAATWGDGTAGVTGVVSAANSLVGSTLGDQVGLIVTALSNGNYVVASSAWDNGGIGEVGAATWGSGTSGVSGVVSAANSLVGSRFGDNVGNEGVTALTNGNYVVASASWDNDGTADVGAATWGSGTGGVTGVVSAANSLIGSASSDLVGYTGVTALSNGNYVVRSPNWNNGALTNAGAATWGIGTTAATGVISTANSLLGTIANTSLNSIVADDVNKTFIAVWTEVGRVLVGPQEYRPVIESAVDMPADQGGWLRLTFHRAGLDAANSLLPVATYAVWRHVPGTSPAGAVHADQRAALGAHLDAPAIERLRTELPAGLDLREAGGRFYVVLPGSPAPGEAAAFPPGNWELMASVPALQQNQYVIAVPTISNGTANDFVVSAHTTTPSIWYVSDPASGQSVENQAPTTPTGLTAHYDYLEGQTDLQWAANPEADVDYYGVYRGASEDFVPSEGNRIAEVGPPHHADVGPAGSYYKVSAVDVNGNASGFALIGPNQTTDVGDEGPVVFALEGVRPNPTRGSRLHVAFALPSGAAARLELLDVSGRRVLEREVGSLGAGRHTVDLAQGRRVAPGLYWVRLAQGTNQRTTRVAVSE